MISSSCTMFSSCVACLASLLLVPLLFNHQYTIAQPLDDLSTHDLSRYADVFAVLTSRSTAKRATVHKRGVAYNNPGNVSLFQVSGSKVSWSYNWSPVKGSTYTAPYAFVPMLWGPGDDSVWKTDLAANKLAANAPLFFFNEPEGCVDGQSCVTDPKTAASEFKAHMQPWAGKFKLGSPVSDLLKTV